LIRTATFLPCRSSAFRNRLGNASPTLIFIALFTAGLSLLSHGRVPLFVGLWSGYVAAAALLAGLYETWKDDEK
jgi:hypothetical protein